MGEKRRCAHELTKFLVTNNLVSAKPLARRPTRHLYHGLCLRKSNCRENHHRENYNITMRNG